MMYKLLSGPTMTFPPLCHPDEAGRLSRSLGSINLLSASHTYIAYFLVVLDF